MSVKKLQMRLDHIGFVVKDIEEYRDYYIKTFCCKPLSDIIDEPAHGVKIMFLETGYGNMPMIELITPSSTESKVSGFLDKTGGGIHHLAYEVVDINEAIVNGINKQIIEFSIRNSIKKPLLYCN